MHACMLCLLLTTVSVFGFDETNVKEIIRLEFPEVTQIPADSILTWQSTEAGPYPILLDVREPAEYSVSHLKGALRAQSEDEALEILMNVPKDTLLIVYCSVGYRSTELGEKLMQRGFTNVRNLEGSIFEWANRGLPVYRGDRPVNVVHPFDETWGTLLDRSLWATAPDSSDFE